MNTKPSDVVAAYALAAIVVICLTVVVCLGHAVPDALSGGLLFLLGGGVGATVPKHIATAAAVGTRTRKAP